MADKNKTIMGMDGALLDFLQTMNKYEDVIVRMPNRHQVLFKILGPLYRTYLKLDMAADSVKTTFTKTEKTTKTLSKATKGLIAPLAITVGLFKALTMSIFPIVGMVMAILGVMMLFVAALDQGGGALRGWLEEIPIIGEVFGAVQAAVDMLKGVLTGEGDAGILAPVADAANYVIGVVVDAFNTIIGLIPPIDGEAIFGTVFAVLGFYIEYYSTLFKTAVEMVVMLFTSIAESGAFSAILDSIMDLWSSVSMIFGVFSGMLGDSGASISGFFGTIIDLWGALMSFLVNSGIFAFVGDVIALIIDIVNTVVVMVAAVVFVVVKAVQFLWPVIEPYFKMLFNYYGMVATVLMAVVRTVIKVVQALLAVFRGDFDAAGKHISGIVDVWKKAFTSFKDFFSGFIDAIMDFLSPLIDAIKFVVEGVGSVAGMIGDGIGAVGGLLGFADGGVVSGPTSGYPVALHGTEAVVPLPDGKTIPVSITGLKAGDNYNSDIKETNITNNINITISGNEKRSDRELAEVITKELLKMTGMRGSGIFGRGI